MALLVLACVGSGKDLAAAEWAVKGSLDQQLQYNDNFALSTVRKESVAGYLLTPSLQATGKTEVLDVAFDGRGDIRRYDDSHWDCDNYNLGMNNSYRSRRSLFGLSGGYGVSCSYSQQITDTGLILPNSQSINYRLAPSWTWQWTTRDQLLLGATYSKTSFSNSQGSVVSNVGGSSFGFIGNDTYSVNLGVNHEWDRYLTLNGKVNFSNIQYTGATTSTQNLFGFQLGANYLVNRNWTVGGGGGPVWVDSQQSSNGVSPGTGSSLSLGSTANINLSYSEQSTKFSTGFSNAINPSVIGQTLQTQSVFANYSYQLARSILFDLSGSFSRSQSIGSQASGNNSAGQFNRTYYTVTPGIAWDFEKNWRLKGSYVYRRQTYQQDNNLQILNVGTSDSNMMMISLNYTWDGIRQSR
jgi:hypothetical protein